MLFGYPIEATGENWLHESLCKMVISIHKRLDAGKSIPEWLDIIPKKHREALRKRSGLRDRLETYGSAASTLTVAERRRVIKCLVEQNRIPQLCSCDADCELIDELPEAIRAPVSDLFEFAFESLTSLGIRDRQYELIFDKISYQVCPFCGCEYFDAPGAPREDMDHYLLKKRYPFAAVNLQNLAPMGMRCNERYKLETDILHGPRDVRRRAFNPYSDNAISINLEDSVPFGGADGQTPEWRIDFEPELPECLTWDAVFRVKERIGRDVLDPSFHRWLADFASWFKIRYGGLGRGAPTLLAALQTYAEDLEIQGLRAREFLRAPVFRMLHHHCESGNERLKTFMTILLAPATSV